MAVAATRHSHRSRSVRPREELDLIRVPDWSTSLPWLAHGFSTRTAGSTTAYSRKQKAGELNLGFTRDDDPANVALNRRQFLQAVCGSDGFSLSTVKQIHSALIHRIVGEASSEDTLRGDGLITDEPGILLAIKTADCFSVLLADTRNRAVAALHAGWRGTLARIAEKCVGRMRMEFGSRPEDILAAIGPGIGSCCYRVGDEVLDQFESQFSYAPELFHRVSESDPIHEKYPLLFLTARPPGHSDLGPSLYLNLAEANRRQLIAAGIDPESIHMVDECTECHMERFFSHRGEHGRTGRMMSAIGIRPTHRVPAGIPRLRSRQVKRVS